MIGKGDKQKRKKTYPQPFGLWIGLIVSNGARRVKPALLLTSVTGQSHPADYSPIARKIIAEKGEYVKGESDPAMRPIRA